MYRSRGRSRHACVIAVQFLLLAASAAGSTEPTVPIARGFVSDYAGVVEPQTVSELERLIGELKQKTGAEIAVVVVNTTEPLSAFDYAIKIAESWRPGQQGKDNGVVFLAAVKDRELFILTGYGVEGPLPDGRVGEIRDRLIIPAFRRGDYTAGVRAGTWELAQAIAADAGVTLSGNAPSMERGPPQPVSGIVLLAIALLILLWLSNRPWWSILIDPRLRGRRRWGHWQGHNGGFGGFGGGGGGGFGGGGFGGFGGGRFGGGGAGGRW